MLSCSNRNFCRLRLVHATFSYFVKQAWKIIRQTKMSRTRSLVVWQTCILPEKGWLTETVSSVWVSWPLTVWALTPKQFPQTYASQSKTRTMTSQARFHLFFKACTLPEKGWLTVTTGTLSASWHPGLWALIPKTFPQTYAYHWIVPLLSPFASEQMDLPSSPSLPTQRENDAKHVHYKIQGTNFQISRDNNQMLF